jgi:hypothetical protein
MYSVIKSLKHYVISKISDYVKRFWIIKILNNKKCLNHKNISENAAASYVIKLLYIRFVLAGC